MSKVSDDVDTNLAETLKSIMHLQPLSSPFPGHQLETRKVVFRHFLALLNEPGRQHPDPGPVKDLDHVVVTGVVEQGQGGVNGWATRPCAPPWGTGLGLWRTDLMIEKWWKKAKQGACKVCLTYLFQHCMGIKLHSLQQHDKSFSNEQLVVIQTFLNEGPGIVNLGKVASDLQLEEVECSRDHDPKDALFGSGSGSEKSEPKKLEYPLFHLGTDWPGTSMWDQGQEAFVPVENRVMRWLLWSGDSKRGRIRSLLKQILVGFEKVQRPLSHCTEREFGIFHSWSWHLPRRKVIICTCKLKVTADPTHLVQHQG